MDKIHIPMDWRMRNVWLVIKSLRSGIFFFPLTQLKLCWKPSCYLWEVKEFQKGAGEEVRVLASELGGLFQQKGPGPPGCPGHLQIPVVLETFLSPWMSRVVWKVWSLGWMWLLRVSAPLFPAATLSPIWETDTHESIDDSHHMFLNIGDRKQKGMLPIFPLGCKTDSILAEM